MRYSLDSSKVKALGWSPKHNFENSLRLTAEWYVANEKWWREIKEGGEYQAYYKRNYENR
jgi:dTDP-glucose 4,6-dehydratase